MESKWRGAEAHPRLERPARDNRAVLCWRRTVLLAAPLVVLALVGCRRSAGPGGQIVVASYGGAWQEAQRATMFQPFAGARNVAVRDVTYDGQYAKIKEMVNAGRPEWDVVDVEGNMVILGAREGILEPIDSTVVKKSDLIEGALHPYGVGIVAWSWVLAYRGGVLTPEQAASSWKVFFDPQTVPGARGMRNDPRRTLEIALLADGVQPSQLYPLDVDRAFAVLTRFRSAMRAKGYPIVWWDEYARPPQLLSDSEVVMTPAANGRVADAQKEGAPIDFTWNQGIVDLDWWVVPRGAPNRAVAMQFIAYASSAEPQAAVVQRIPYGPVSREALARLPDSVATRLPTYPGNLQRQIMFNTEWWAANLDRVQERWNTWRTAAR